MKTAKLIINGKEYEVQLTDDEIIEIEKPKKVTGFERADEQHCYYFEDDWKIMNHCPEQNSINDENRYAVANYYSDESLAERCNRNDALIRQMRRWAAEHNDEPIDWEDRCSDTCFISYNYEHKEVDITHCYATARAGVVYFCMREIAEEAIEEFGDEIKWLAENRPKWF